MGLMPANRDITLLLLSIMLPILLLGVAEDAVGAPSDANVSAAAAADNAAVAIKVDGELNEAAWARAEPLTAFVQRDPLEGAPPTLRTEARVRLRRRPDLRRRPRLRQRARPHPRRS